MAAQPADSSLGAPPPQRTWSPASDPWGPLDDAPWNSMDGEDFQASSPVHYIVHLVTLLVSLCGVLGNGAVIYLRCGVWRTHFSNYIVNLAWVDLLLLLTSSVQSTLELSNLDSPGFQGYFEGTWKVSHLAGLGLLVAFSSERCVSALWPDWYKDHRPVNFSYNLCILIWLLFFCVWISGFVCSASGLQSASFELTSLALAIIVSLVLAVSGLMLLVRVLCGPGRPQRSRLDVTILLIVLASLLLRLPHTVGHLVDIVATNPFNFLRLAITSILFLLNSAVNPIIYLLVGSHGQPLGRAPLREVLQRALRDKGEGTEQGDTPDNREATTPF